MSFQNPTFNQVSQAAHAFAAYSFVLTAQHFFGFKCRVVVTCLFVAYGLAKEFWYDLKYERLDVSGGIDGGITDFLFYCIGLVSANLALSLKSL